ncbi:MAG TPA: LD-carboxypeptidase [Candidatus Koribacter sp.]
MPRPASIRPPALVEGDTIGIVAPASNIDPNALAAACTNLKRMGYVPYYLDSIVDRDLYFAGSVQRRVAELEHMFAKPEVRAVLCARGGYGANYLLPHLDVNKFLANPKPFIGYSDNTCLLTWLADHGLVTFHGPMATKDFASQRGVDEAWWKLALGSAAALERSFAPTELEVIATGEGEGILYGGCLSILVASLGTPYEIKTDGTILFLEDMNEKPYQVDRMLMQLKFAGKFENVRGVIVGEMLDCVQPNGQDYSLQDVIGRVLGDLKIPIVYGFSSGHVRGMNRVLPLGVQASLHAGDSVRLRLEAAVSQR